MKPSERRVGTRRLTRLLTLEGVPAVPEEAHAAPPRAGRGGTHGALPWTCKPSPTDAWEHSHQNPPSRPKGHNHLQPAAAHLKHNREVQKHERTGHRAPDTTTSPIAGPAKNAPCPHPGLFSTGTSSASIDCPGTFALFFAVRKKCEKLASGLSSL